MYPPSAHQFVSRPDLVVDLENFATGEKHLLGTVTLWDPIAGEEMISASKVYVGEFSQSLTSFEMSCYPFDYKEVFFRIGLQILGKHEGDIADSLPRIFLIEFHCAVHTLPVAKIV